MYVNYYNKEKLKFLINYFSLFIILFCFLFVTENILNNFNRTMLQWNFSPDKSVEEKVQSVCSWFFLYTFFLNSA